MSVCRAGERTIGLKMKPCTSVDIPGLDRLRPVCGEQQVSGGLLFNFSTPMPGEGPHRAVPSTARYPLSQFFDFGLFFQRT